MITARPLPHPASVAGLLLLLAALAPASLGAQERLRDFSEGDGRIHGAPILQVSEHDLHPGQVQTINLHPRYHTVLAFPYPVARVDAGDPDVFMADVVGNKLTLKATKLTQSETSMSVILGDADMTVIPFLVRADSSQPIAYVVKYTDPVSKHLNRAERQIARRLQRDVDQRVERLAEKRLQQRLLFGSDVIEIDKEKTVGREGEQLWLEIQSAQRLPGENGTPRLYIRYRILNRTVAPLNDLSFVVRLDRTETKFLVAEETKSREIYDVQDVRSAEKIPPGAAAEGLLILDAIDLEDNEAISIEAVAFNEQRHVKIDRVLVGQ